MYSKISPTIEMVKSRVENKRSGVRSLLTWIGKGLCCRLNKKKKKKIIMDVDLGKIAITKFMTPMVFSTDTTKVGEMHVMPTKSKFKLNLTLSHKTFDINN